MNKQNEIDMLMKEWKLKHIKKGYEKFISDGIVCEKVWEEQRTPKVCFFLKEAYTDEDEANNSFFTSCFLIASSSAMLPFTLTS